jgi:hypothetical protein
MALILSFCGAFGKPPPLESARALPQTHRVFNTKPSTSIIETLVLDVARSLVARTLRVTPCNADVSYADAPSCVCGACAWQFLISVFS